MIDNTGDRILINDALHADSLTGDDHFIGEDSCVDGKCGVEEVFTDDFELHVVLFPAEEVDAELVFPLEPLAEVDAGTVPDIDDFPAFGGSLPEGVGGLALEGAHLVFLFAFDLVGDR